MLKFIVLHFPIEGEVSFNVEDILCFFARDDDTIIRAKDGNCYAVTESYDEVKALIKDAGVLIHKPDPRLNLTKPLTLEYLKYMEGEPVWNSNSGEWGLVTKDPEWRGELQDGYYFRHHDGTITMLWDEGLIRYPLYRMHQ